MTTKNQYQRIVPFFIFALALLLLFKLVQPMITVILSGILLAYVAFPLYARIHKRISNDSLSIIMALCVIVMVVLVPLAFFTFEVAQQGYVFYDSLSTKMTKGAILGYGCTSAESKVCAIVNQLEAFSKERLSAFGFDKQLQKLPLMVEEMVTGLILSVPVMLVQAFLSLVIAYFIMKEWRSLLTSIVDLLPMRKKTIRRLTEKFQDIAHTVIFAQLFVALVQGIIGAVGFYLFGVPFPILLGLLLAFCSLIPTIGTAIVWLPVSLSLIIIGAFSHEYWILARGVGLFLYGLFIISTIDNVLLVKIVHAKAKVNQIIVIVGVIGGAAMFGIPGIFIGPILLPLLLTYFETFKERFA